MLLADRVRTLWSFAGQKLEQYGAAVDALARANKTLSAFHAQRKEDVRSGARPSVRQSLDRLASSVQLGGDHAT